MPRVHGPSACFRACAKPQFWRHQSLALCTLGPTTGSAYGHILFTLRPSGGWFFMELPWLRLPWLNL